MSVSEDVVKPRAELSPEAVDLLRAGAAHSDGCPITYASEAKRKRAFLLELEARGFLRFLNFNEPMVTDAGRAFIGAPGEMEQSRQRLAEWGVKFAVARAAMKQAAGYDGRTPLEYKHLNETKTFCVPVYRHRQGETTEFSRDGGPAPHAYVRTEKLWVQPESIGDFLLIFIRKSHANWLKNNHRVDLFAVPPELSSEGAWTDEDRDAWKTVRRLSANINRHIRNPRLASKGHILTGYGATA